MSDKNFSLTPAPDNPEMDELIRERDYLRRSVQETAGRLFALEAQSIVMRHELEQKRRGFSLMAELTVSLGKESDYEKNFVSVSKRINSILSMQRTVVLTPDDGAFKPLVLHGYSDEEAAELAKLRLNLDDELLDPGKPVLVTGADPEERLADFRQALRLPFFISSPIMLQDDVAAVLVTGRIVEQRPYLLRLGESDVETVQTVCAYLAAMLAGLRVQDAEERTHIMLDAMPMGCVLWDKDFRRVDCNEAAPTLFGLADREEFLEKFWELVPEYQPDGQPSEEFIYEMLKSAQEQGYGRFEYLHKKIDGTLLPVEVTLVRVRHGRDNIVVAYLRDLREIRATLEAMHKTQDELRLARDLAEKSAKAKSEFLANMSHEIRTPMNAIVGMTHLLAGSKLDEKQRNYVDKAGHSANLLLRIINDILDFSKIEAGRMDTENIQFSLHQITSNVHDIISGQAAAKGLDWQIDVASDVPDGLVGDPMRLEQVLINLANNAVKFTPSGQVKATVSLRRMFEDNGTAKAEILFEVRDTGIGMSEEQLTTLFSPFTQADSSITRKFGGTGLGLAISRSLIELMGGEISCVSSLGKGSKFTFTVTLNLADAVADEADGAALGDCACENCLAGIRVLLAEDNEINQMIAVDMLEGQGALVNTVGTGLEAIKALQQNDYDVVLMDIQMPEMDGLSATAEIRANPRWEDLPIIAMTAHAMSGDREVSLEAGMDDHLTKPIEPDKMFAAIRRWAKH